MLDFQATRGRVTVKVSKLCPSSWASGRPEAIGRQQNEALLLPGLLLKRFEGSRSSWSSLTVSSLVSPTRGFERRPANVRGIAYVCFQTF